MLETAAVSTTFIKCGTISSSVSHSLSAPTSDPLLWDSHPFPDSASKFVPIKQEVTDSYESYDMTNSQNDFTELKPLPFDYGVNCLTGVDPVLPNNNNNGTNNNNKPMADLNIYIKPLSPPTPSSGRESFSFNQSPSDVTSSGSLTPPGLTKIDFPADQNAFDDIASIVGISMGADSTVPTLENDLDLDAWIENTASNIKPLHDGSHMFNQDNSPSSMSSTPAYLNHPMPLAHLLQQANIKLPKVTSLEQRDPPPFNLSPILQSRLTGYSGFPGGLLKVESSSYYPSVSSDQMPHSTVTTLPDHRRLGLDQRPKQKNNKQRPDASDEKIPRIQIKDLHQLLYYERPIGGGHGSGGGDPNKKQMMHHCQICNRGFLNKSNIKVHLRTHTGEKPFGCEHCSKAFRQKAHLLKHMSIHKRISRD